MKIEASVRVDKETGVQRGKKVYQSVVFYKLVEQFYTLWVAKQEASEEFSVGNSHDLVSVRHDKQRVQVNFGHIGDGW